MSVPDWVQDAVFYQIFPDRFANGDHTNDPSNVREWLSSPTIKGFHGGDIQGVIDHLDYLVDLGVNAIYFNPIFQAASTHRYDTSDYLRIDPKLGDMDDFHNLIQEAHRRGIRIILDGVFNHCGRGFYAFSDILENEMDSPYLNWFHVKALPLDAYGSGEAVNYLGWWGYKSLPKFNTDEPAVRKYLLHVAKFWIEQGADGWRLDVPNEIDDDAFWAEFRSVVKSANPEAYIVGEIWDGNPRWVGENHFDGLMNYPVRDAVFDVISGTKTALQFGDKVESLLKLYPDENTRSMLVLLGSHDTRRMLRKVNGKKEKMKLAAVFPFVYPGAPCIYYGDEIALDGGKDPDCRRAFPWNERLWDQDMRAWFQRLIQIRIQEPVLRRGDFQRVFANDRCYGIKRNFNGETIWVLFNFSDISQSITVKDNGWIGDAATNLVNLLDGQIVKTKGNVLQVALPSSSAMILKPAH